MTQSGMKHQNYEILNLIGYGLSKFNNAFVREFGFTTKAAFYRFCVEHGIADTVGTVSNRQDLFDPFFPENKRKGWWQKGDAYIHRKILIDSLFGNESVKTFSDIVKLYLKENFKLRDIQAEVKPIIATKFKKLQETGLEAEQYFMNNFQLIEAFKDATIEDARLYGDGYDFQISAQSNTYLAEVKGIRAKKGRFRLTENEYNKALEYQDDYIIALVLNLSFSPTLLMIENPTKNLSFEQKIVSSKSTKEYHLSEDIC